MLDCRRVHCCPAVLQLLERLVMEASIDQSRRAYCPYKDCSCLLERDEEDLDEDGRLPQAQDAPYMCPSCKRLFCLACHITGWHQVGRSVGYQSTTSTSLVQSVCATTDGATAGGASCSCRILLYLMTSCCWAPLHLLRCRLPCWCKWLAAHC
jgi:hypothetical protein